MKKGVPPIFGKKNGLPPMLEWIQYVTENVKLSNVLNLCRIRQKPRNSNVHAKRQLAQKLGQIAKFNRRFQIPDEPKQD